jgi:hypothetical protein
MQQQPQQDSQHNIVIYGNPNQYDLKQLEIKNYLDTLLSEMEKLPPKENDSEEVLSELHEIIQGIFYVKNNEEILSKYAMYDTEIVEYISSTLSNALPSSERNNIFTTCNDIYQDVLPLVTKLKYKYQRPRPYQLGSQRKLFLYPHNTLNAASPSYPSAHTFYTVIICEVLGNQYPRFYKQLMDLAEDVSKSRLYLGVNYMSDITAAVDMANMVLLNKEFKKKYKF